MNENGSITKEKIISLLQIFQLSSDTKDEAWSACVPILVDLCIANPSFFKDYRFIQQIMAEHPIRFQKNDIEKLLDLYRKEDFSKIDECLIYLFDSHEKVFEAYQHKMVETEENVECLLKFFVYLS